LATGRFLSDRTTGLKFGSGAYVSFGSKADIPVIPSDVRFTPKSGHREMRQGRHLHATRKAVVEPRTLRDREWTARGL